MMQNKWRYSYLLVLLIFLGACRNNDTAQQHWTEPHTGMAFVRIPPGKFLMGTPVSKVGQLKLGRSHEVEITRAFYIGKYEVTQGEWQQIMGDNPSHFKALGDNFPVENINWHEAQTFIRLLNELNPPYRFALPTEAQWEYACRAGTSTPFNTGENLSSDDANYDGRYPYRKFPKGHYRNQPTAVGSFPANGWGLHDMHGNVWEWCADWFCEYPAEPAKDPFGECETDLKVIRGGSWYFNAESARSARRYTHNPVDRGFSLGFRLVREVVAVDFDE